MLVEWPGVVWLEPYHFGQPQGLQCAVPVPPEAPPIKYESWHICLKQDPRQHLARGPPNMERLWVTLAKFGGSGLDLRKVPCLIAYLLCDMWYVIHLQELGPAFTPAWLHGLPCIVKVWPLFVSGGLASLLH